MLTSTFFVNYNRCRDMRPPLPPNKRRVLFFGRVEPGTMEYIRGLGFKNIGRALDWLAKQAEAIGINRQADPPASP